MSVTVRKQYLCGYHCQSCGWFNIEAGEIEAKADMQAEAAELAQRLFQNVKSGVNQRTEYGMPGIKGVCRKCGTKQVWSSHERKTSVAEKALFAMMGVSLVIGAVGMLIYQNLLPVLLGSVLAMALLGVELRMTSRVNKAYRESVCKQVDEELSSVIGWNPYPYVAASDDAADPSDERSVKLAQHMESLHNNRSPSLSGILREITQEKVPQPRIPQTYPFTQWHVSGDPMYGIVPNDPVVEFVDEKTGHRTTIINEKRIIQNFPGIENEDEIRKMLGEGSLMPYNSFGADFRIMEDGRYQMIWEIQPDGQMFWQDEDGFGGTSDSEIKLGAIIDQQGRFATPFSLYSINGIRR